jgi:DNA-binding LytR/AlgR family response regulator
MENHDEVCQGFGRTLSHQSYPNWGDESPPFCHNFVPFFFTSTHTLYRQMLPLPPPPPTHLRLLRGQVLLSITDIMRLEADRNYTRFVLTNGQTLLTSKNISFYEQILPKAFLRVNKSYLLNRTYVLTIHQGYAQMNDGFSTQVSRRKRSQMNQNFKSN